MLNQSADYALRAVLFMAQQGADTVARAIGVPRNYLGKVLRTLAQSGVLDSVRGPRGGFRLAVEPDALTLVEVVGPFQRLPTRNVCLLGNRRCDPSNPCGAHRQWQETADRVTGFFRLTTIASLLADDADARASATDTLAELIPAPHLTSTRRP
jgi:Rrf2 family transcriptional regulator, iron-sulfur cluster assembly transcription factor